LGVEPATSRWQSGRNRLSRPLTSLPSRSERRKFRSTSPIPLVSAALEWQLE
jgi:hypothetical protein